MRRLIVLLLALVCLAPTIAIGADIKFSAFTDQALGDISSSDYLVGYDNEGGAGSNRRFSVGNIWLWYKGVATLGTFTGTTIPDSSTVTAAFQALETALELQMPKTGGTFSGAVTVEHADGVALGKAATTQGNLKFFSNTPENNYTFQIYGANFAANLGWRLPAAAPGGSNYLLNVDADGTMDYTNPSAFAAVDGALGTPSFTALNMPSSDASPSTTAGQIRHDSTVTGLTGGAVAWWDGTSVRYLVDLDTLPSSDDYVVAYDADADKFYMKADANDGGGYTNLTSFVDQTAWRVFYSDGSGDVKELALGSDGEYLKSNGASAAPSWATPSGAAHDAVTLSTDLGNNLLGLSTQQLTLDTQTANYVFAGPTTGEAVAPSFRALVAGDIPSLTGTYAAIAGTPSTSFQIDNDASGPKLKNSSGTIEARNAADDAYADIKGKDGYFAHVYSTAANGAYYVNYDNTVAITFTPAQGDLWSYSNEGVSTLYFYDGSGNRKVLHAGSSTADFPTLNQNTTGTAAGLTAQYVDWSASSGGASIANKPTIIDWTADQGATNIHSGNIPDLSGTYATTSHAHTYTESFAVKSPVDADDFLLLKAPTAITVTALNCVSQGSTPSVSVAVQECDGDGANCADGGISLTADGSNDADTSFTDASIDSGDWLKVILGAPTGTVNFLSCTMSYTR